MNLLPIYFPELNENQLKQLDDLALLLSDWNQKINVSLS
jgi:16S rRNA G527 N7-methylase RsmG